MIFCVPSESTGGLSAPASMHFGSCSYFTIHDDGTGTTDAVPNRNTHDSHGRCRPLESIEGRGVQVVLAGGMGRGAVTRLAEAGIPVYCGNEPTVGDMIDAFKAGRLPALTPDEACAGHGHHH